MIIRLQNTTKYRKLTLAIISLMVLIGLWNIAAFAETAPALALHEESIVIAKGKSQRIAVDFSGPQTKLKWESDDPEIAVVNAGNVTGKKNGTTLIRCVAVLEDGKELSADCEVTVYTPVQNMKITQGITIDIGQEIPAPEIEFFPADASYQSVVWTSENEAIATADESGKIKGISAGTCRVIATSTESLSGNSNAKTAVCKVTVDTPVSSITIEGQEQSVVKGKSLRLTATVLPENATKKTLTWESSDPDIASVANGNVSAKAAGSVVIRCSASNHTGETVVAEYPLTVLSPVTQIKSEYRDRIVITEGDSISLSVTVLPEDASNKNVSWESNSPETASVDDSGKLTANQAGDCIITAQSMDGSNKSAKISVLVEPRVPLVGSEFKRSGPFGTVSQISVRVKNITKTKTITSYSLGVKYTYHRREKWYQNLDSGYYIIAPGKSDILHVRFANFFYMTFGSNYRVYLRSVQYSDGTREDFQGEEAFLCSE